MNGFDLKVVTLVPLPGTEDLPVLQQVSSSLKGRGWRVGALKHDAERMGFQMNHPGTETLTTFFADADIVLTEGFSESNFPKVLLCSTGEEGILLCRIDSDASLDDLPLFEASDISGIARFIEEAFLRGQELRASQAVAASSR